jgi:hypothetical protein
MVLPEALMFYLRRIIDRFRASVGGPRPPQQNVEPKTLYTRKFSLQSGLRIFAKVSLLLFKVPAIKRALQCRPDVQQQKCHCGKISEQVRIHSAILPVASLRRNGPLVPTLRRRPKKEGVLCLCPRFCA